MSQFNPNENPLKLEDISQQVMEFSIDCNKEDSSEMKPRVKNPLEILEILEHVMKQLESKDLFNCRKVSELWNQAAVRILTEIPAFYTGSKCFRTRRLKMEQKIPENFKTLLKESKQPQLLFNNISICMDKNVHSYSILLFFDVGPRPRPIDIPQVQTMLNDFGKHVKILKIEEDSNDFGTLIKCVGPNGFCPNVQVLKVVALKNKSSSSPLGQIETRNLKQLILKEKKGCGRNNYVELFTVLDRILQTAREINSLVIKCPRQSKTTTNCLALLQTVPYITKNLKVLHMNGNVHENIKALCKIQFKNLKIVKFQNMDENCIDDIAKNQLLKREKMKGFRKFLELVSNSLESFYVLDVDERELGFDMPNLPFMPMLKDCKSYTCENGDDPFILEKCPSLRVLRFVTMDDLQGFLEKYFEIKNPAMPASLSNCVPKLVHKNLERIAMLGGGSLVVDSHITIQMLNTLCPKFQELDIRLKIEECSVEGQKMLFEQVFYALSRMEHLKKLVITVGHNGEWEFNKLLGAVDLTLAFSFLKASQSLEVLTFCGFKVGNPNYKLLTKHLLAVRGADKLCLVKLPDFPVTEKNEEIRLKAINIFALSNITLKVGYEDEDEVEEEESDDGDEEDYDEEIDGGYWFIGDD